MITSSILMVVLKIVSPLVSLFKPINVLVNSAFISYVFDVVSGVLYFLPVGTINTILGIFGYVGYTCYNRVFACSMGHFTDCIVESVFV